MKGLLVVLFACTLAAQTSGSLADLPDPIKGTDAKFELSHGNTYPRVFLPFAMLAWTPQTGEGGWPYRYSAETIRGFRATHRGGVYTEANAWQWLSPVQHDFSMTTDFKVGGCRQVIHE